MTEITFTKEDQQSFESYLSKQQNGCWLYLGALKNGYGKFWSQSQKKLIHAHRFAYTCFIGPIPDGMCILHSCDNPSCCNPQHLTVGTQEENMQQCLERGRWHEQKGQENNAAKLTEEVVKEIRFLCDLDITQKTIAKKFGVSLRQVHHIRAHKQWCHI
jgi:hypothetical protein